MISQPAPRTGAAPWQANRYQLWSLLDMLRFYGATFVAAISNLEHARAVVMFGPEGHDSEYQGVIQGHLVDLATELEKLPVSQSLRAQAKRLSAHVATANWQVVNVVVNEFQQSLLYELSEQLFLWIPAQDKWTYLEPEKNYWTLAIHDAFPDAHRDMRDCARALALDLWTASVFHAMRVVQHGLRKLCDRLQVTFAKDFDVLSWGEIIKHIDKRLKEIEQTPKTPQRDAELEFGAQASSHFFAIKEAWRNYVMHGRSTYDEPEARSIAANVRDIMRALA